MSQATNTAISKPYDHNKKSVITHGRAHDREFIHRHTFDCMSRDNPRRARAADLSSAAKTDAPRCLITHVICTLQVLSIRDTTAQSLCFQYSAGCGGAVAQLTTHLKLHVIGWSVCSRSRSCRCSISHCECLQPYAFPA
jgi:hypothetical protein